jgi:hypothetical protein
LVECPLVGGSRHRGCRRPDPRWKGGYWWFAVIAIDQRFETLEISKKVAHSAATECSEENSNKK